MSGAWGIISGESLALFCTRCSAMCQLFYSMILSDQDNQPNGGLCDKCCTTGTPRTTGDGSDQPAPGDEGEQLEEETMMMHPDVDERSGNEHPCWSVQEIPVLNRRENKAKTTRRVREAVHRANSQRRGSSQR